MTATISLPNLPIPESQIPLFTKINTAVHAYMSSPTHDNSHDYHHILRVVSNANKILTSEHSHNPSKAYNNTALFLAAFLHDIGDHKYASEEDGDDVENLVSNMLKRSGADEELAMRVQTVVKHVGYTNETKNPQSVVDVLAEYPELGVVQDADRLDAIGAVGVARCFAFGGAKKKGQPMAQALEHFDEKLIRLPEMMKTESGRKLAERRREVLVEFKSEFEEEAMLSF